MERQLTPIGSMWRGLLAGLAGAAVQTLFFRLTSGVAPKPPESAFQPPEPQQQDESATATVARRLAMLAGRAGLSDRGKQRGATLVHFGFGGLWGTAYAAVRESTARVRGPLAAVGYATSVWLVSDNLLLPAFKLSAWPARYPARNHLYAWLAHLPYGITVLTGYELLRRRGRPRAVRF